jgi:hypothetical protein
VQQEAYSSREASSSGVEASLESRGVMREVRPQGLSWHDPGAGSRNKLSGWVDSDFASDIDTHKSMTGY